MQTISDSRFPHQSIQDAEMVSNLTLHHGKRTAILLQGLIIFVVWNWKEGIQWGMVRKSEGAWWDSLSRSWSCWVLVFLDIGSGDEDTDADDATAQESFELSELNETSITPFGLPGMELNLRLFDWLPSTLVVAHSIINSPHSFTFSCFTSWIGKIRIRLNFA